MDFTRQPIIETVITAKEGFKLVVRSSKSSGQEEYFVDAVEVVSFGNSFFFRSTEKPKAFLVPTTDYEILEVREARMVLKNVGMDKSIKIGGGKEPGRGLKEQDQKAQEALEKAGTRQEKKRERRKSYRKRREKDESQKEQEQKLQEDIEFEQPKINLPEPKAPLEPGKEQEVDFSTTVLRSLLPPPPNLISETIEKYKDNDLFRGAFFQGSEEKEVGEKPQEEPTVPLTQPEYGSFEMTEEEEEAIFQQRKREHGMHAYDVEEINTASLHEQEQEEVSSKSLGEFPKDEPEDLPSEEERGEEGHELGNPNMTDGNATEEEVSSKNHEV